MTLVERIENDFRTAMKARDAVRVEALKMLRAAMLRARTAPERAAKGGKDAPLSDADVIALVRKEVKSRREAIEAYRKGGREELAKKEEAEIEALSRYLPPELSDADLAALVAQVAMDVGTDDRGRLIREVIARAEGGADGKRVAAAVAAFLAKR